MNAVFKALSDPTRRGVLELLRKRPMTAGELCEKFPFSRSTMSAHFTILREAGLVTSEKQGQSVIYQLQTSVLEDALMSFVKIFGWDLRGKPDPEEEPAR